MGGRKKLCSVGIAGMAVVCLLSAWPLAAQDLRVTQVLRGPDAEARGMVFAGGGRHAYTAIFGAAQFWDRDLETGDVTYRRGYPDPAPPPGVPFEAAVDLELSPDERFLYVLYAADRGVLSVFARDPSSGELSAAQRLELDEGGGRPGALAVSPDGRHVYAGGRVLRRYARDAASGLLTFLGGQPVAETGGLAFVHGGAVLLQGEGLGKRLQSFVRDPSTGALSPVDSLGSFAEDPTSYVGRLKTLQGPGRVMASVRTVNSLPPFPVLSYHLALVDVSPEGELTLVGSTGVAGGIDSSAHGFAISPAGDEVVVSTFDGNGVTSTLTLYALQGDGTLLAIDFAPGGFQQGLAQGRALAYGPGGRQVYASGFAGQLLATVPVGEGPDRFGEPLPALRLVRPVDLAVAPDGRVLVQQQTGLLQASRAEGGLAIESWRHHPGSQGRSLSLSPDGRFLYAAFENNFDGSIFSRLADGSYELLEQNIPFGGPTAISPDGLFLLSPIDFSSGPLTIWRLDPESGSVISTQFSEIQLIDLHSLSFLQGGRRLIAVDGFTPGGRYFAFDPATERVTELPAFEPAFADSEALVASADGELLYSAWRIGSDLWLATLGRSGDSIFIVTLNLLASSPPTSDPALELDPSGRFLYAYDGVGSLTVWGLDPETGLPSQEPLQTFTEGADGVDWLGAGVGFACCVTLTATPDRLYVANKSTSTLATLDRGCDPSDDRRHCFQDRRFAVELAWQTPAGETGVGRRIGESSEESGLFWFFTPDNWEMLVKVLDGCDFNDHYWVFAAATTNVGFTLTVTDTWTGREAVYENPVGASARTIVDTETLDLCE